MEKNNDECDCICVLLSSKDHIVLDAPSTENPDSDPDQDLPEHAIVRKLFFSPRYTFTHRSLKAACQLHSL